MDIGKALSLCADLCKEFEGFKAHPYLCPAGVPTIGYGATYYLDGRRVCLKDAPITKITAEVMLKDMLRKEYLPSVLKLCSELEDTGMLAAIVDFAYNCGVGNLTNSTLRKRIKARRWGDVPTELRKWNRGGGRVLNGLVRRREAEIRLIGITDE